MPGVADRLIYTHIDGLLRTKTLVISLRLH